MGVEKERTSSVNGIEPWPKTSIEKINDIGCDYKEKNRDDKERLIFPILIIMGFIILELSMKIYYSIKIFFSDIALSSLVQLYWCDVSNHD